MFNTGALNAEKETIRIFMNGAITHPILGALPSQGSLPVPQQGTGSVSTLNNDLTNGTLVTGVGTKFTNDTQTGSKTKFTGEVCEGDYLAINSAGQMIRRIVQVKSDTQLVIESAFPSSLAGTNNFYIIKKNQYRMIYAKAVGSANAILQEQTFVAGETFLNGGAPITYDVSAGASSAISFQIDF